VGVGLRVAGRYSLFHYDLSVRIPERKMENIRATSAEIVVTPCPAVSEEASAAI
jgi:glycolate oxidase iron-sulfur subunit